MTRIRKLMSRIEREMAAISFAEEGEFSAARDMLKEERRVLLAVRGGRVDDKTLRYALNTCKRVGAGLDILSVSPGATLNPALTGFLKELDDEKIAYAVTITKGCLKQRIIEHTEAKKNVLFAVIESEESIDIDCRGSDPHLPEAWQNLKCPLVVVEAASRA